LTLAGAQEIAKEKDGDIILGKITEVRTQVIIVGSKIISEVTNPYGVDADGDPVISLIGLRGQKTLSAYPMSPTAYAVPINKEKCKRRIQFIAAASQSINAPIIEPKDKVKWTGKPGNPNSRGQVSAGAAFNPYRLPGGGMDIAKFVELENRADRDIDDQYDLPDVMRGREPKAANASGRMVLALQDLGGIMSKPFLRALESALIRLAKINIAIILKHWPRYMWDRLIEPDEEGYWTPDGKYEPKDPLNVTEDELEIQEKIAANWKRALEAIRPLDPREPPGIGLIDLDVRLTAGSSMTTNRMAKSEMAIEMVQGGIYDRQAALEYMDDPNVDKIVERMKIQEEQAAAAEAAKK
jgi:hypothetical protein